MNCFESPIPTKEQERILYDAKTDEEWRQACKEIGIPTYVEIIGDETIGEYALRAFHSLQCKEDAERKRREYHGLKEYMAALNKIKIMHQNQEFKKILMSALNELSCIERYEIYLSTVESYLSKYLHKREGSEGKKYILLIRLTFRILCIKSQNYTKNSQVKNSQLIVIRTKNRYICLKLKVWILFG